MKYQGETPPLLGPCRCMGCGQPVYWARRRTRREGAVTALVAWRDWTGWLHACGKAAAA